LDLLNKRKLRGALLWHFLGFKYAQFGLGISLMGILISPVFLVAAIAEGAEW